MLPMCSKSVRARLEKVLEKYHLPTSANCDKDELFKFVSHDKKAEKRTIRTVVVDEVGSFKFVDMTPNEILEREERL